jgi:hypothetical protein
MRRVCLLGSFLALVAALCSLWAVRFERAPGLPNWRLADLRASSPPIPGVEWTGSQDHPILRLRVDPANPRVAACFAIPGVPLAAGLHLRFRMTARGLTAGKDYWEDGRFMVDWHPADGGPTRENVPVGSIRDDLQGDPEDFVLLAPEEPAVPSLRLEHLGRAGEFELSDLEITVIDESQVWKTGKWLLMAGWLAWGVAFIRSWPGIRWWRAICVSTVWLLMGIQFVIPGPWKIQRAIYPNFLIGDEPAGLTVPPPAGQSSGTAVIQSGPIPAVGKIPYQGSFALRVKLQISRARPLLHALLLFFPALAIAFFVGRKPAVFLVIMLALAIEAAETAFGYGFDGDDVLDLLWDAVGIVLAMWAYRKMPDAVKLEH